MANTEQKNFLENLTIERAQRLLNKFDNDPAVAHAAGEDAYAAFCRCFEFINPGEYIQRHRFAGGVQFTVASLTHSAFRVLSSRNNPSFWNRRLTQRCSPMQHRHHD